MSNQSTNQKSLEKLYAIFVVSALSAALLINYRLHHPKHQMSQNHHYKFHSRLNQALPLPSPPHTLHHPYLQHPQKKQAGKWKREKENDFQEKFMKQLSSLNEGDECDVFGEKISSGARKLRQGNWVQSLIGCATTPVFPYIQGVIFGRAQFGLRSSCKNTVHSRDPERELGSVRVEASVELNYVLSGQQLIV